MNNKKVILLVDDEDHVRERMRVSAISHGFDVIEAGNGKEALEWFKEKKPDVIISDTSMPQMNGLELLQWLRSRNLNIPVIFTTAHGTIEVAVEAMKLGAADFITKPIDPAYMIQVINRVFKHSQLERKVREQEEQMKQDLQMAAMIQRCMLPVDVDTESFSLHLRYEPLLGIGGDYITSKLYNDNKMMVALYDVAGHGVAAAMLANVVHHQLTSLIVEPEAPYKIADSLNRFAGKTLCIRGIFFTLVLVFIDAKKKQVVAYNAGHPDILFWKKTQEDFISITSHTPPIGITNYKINERDQSILSIEPGDRIILYSDGFTEARRPNREMLGRYGFRKMVRQSIDLPPKKFLGSIYQAATDFRQGPPKDDLTLAVIDIK